MAGSLVLAFKNFSLISSRHKEKKKRSKGIYSSRTEGTEEKKKHYAPSESTAGVCPTIYSSLLFLFDQRVMPTQIR